MKNNDFALNKFKSLDKIQKKGFQAQYLDQLKRVKSPDSSKIFKKSISKPNSFNIHNNKIETNQLHFKSPQNKGTLLNKNFYKKTSNIPKENLQKLKKKIIMNKNDEKISVIKSQSTSHISFNQKKSYSTLNNQEKYTQSSNYQSKKQLPNNVRIQPIQILFLCSNCYQYFLYPQKNIHFNYCQFQTQKTLIQQKLKRLKEMLEMISKKYPNPYTVAIAKKILKYMNNEISLEDILILEWFIINSKVNVGIIWSELFWVIQKLGKMKQTIQQKNKQNNFFWMLCK